MHNLVAVVTGGGSGIGRTIAHALASNGARAVYVLGRRHAALVETACANPKVIVPVSCDVTSRESLLIAASTVRAHEPFIDVLVANAGSNADECVAHMPPGGARPDDPETFAAAMMAVDPAHFASMFSTNVIGPFYTACAFLPLLAAGTRARSPSPSSSSWPPAPPSIFNNGLAEPAPLLPRRAQILMTTSATAWARAPAARFGYCTSKAASTHLMRQLATYLAPWGVRVNALAPGFIPTDMTAKAGGVVGVGQSRGTSVEGGTSVEDDALSTKLAAAAAAAAAAGGDGDDSADDGQSKPGAAESNSDVLAPPPPAPDVDLSVEGSVPGEFVPLERWGTLDEIAGMALFLLSRAGAYVDGGVLLGDGGFLSVNESAY